MDSFGTVLDLLDERQLNLQDVFGNVAALPTLFQYERYTHCILVHKMDESHEKFMSSMQEHTARKALETGKELWTWCVQWEIDQYARPAPSPKKPRLRDAFPSSPTSPRRPPDEDTVEVIQQSVLNPKFMKEEDTLRVLCDVVQVHSSVLPNFLEFMYRWIDYFEGDGKALKAALKHEIPSLWEFEHHPTTVAEKARQQSLARAAGTGTSPIDVMSEHDKLFAELDDDPLVQKMRQKPDLDAFHRQVEESERRQYREVKYGIQPPESTNGLTPLINIPTDGRGRMKYYDACWQCRQRALMLLAESGVTMDNVNNYKKGQDEHPRNSVPKSNSNGLGSYYNDAQAAQIKFAQLEKAMLASEKTMAASISGRLAEDDRLAAGIAGLDDTDDEYVHDLDDPDSRASQLNAARSAEAVLIKLRDSDSINVIPRSLLGKLKSREFAGCVDSQTLHNRTQAIYDRIHGASGLLSRHLEIIPGPPLPPLPPIANLNWALPNGVGGQAAQTLSLQIPVVTVFHVDGETQADFDQEAPTAPQLVSSAASQIANQGVGSDDSLSFIDPHVFAQAATHPSAQMSETAITQSVMDAIFEAYRTIQLHPVLPPLPPPSFPAARPPLSPLSALAPNLLAVPPLADFTTHHTDTPIQVYFPKVVVPGNFIGPGGAMMGDGGIVETDALLLGHSRPGSGKITFSKAVFLPFGIWESILEQTNQGAIEVLETYAPPPEHGLRPWIPTVADSAHKAAYAKLRQAINIMATGAPDRENHITKRWRVSPGPMTLRDRGAIWEGWAVALDQGIEMSAKERVGARVWVNLISGGDAEKGVVGARVGAGGAGGDHHGGSIAAATSGMTDAERRRKMIDEMLDDEDNYDEVTDQEEDDENEFDYSTDDTLNEGGEDEAEIENEGITDDDGESDSDEPMEG